MRSKAPIFLCVFALAACRAGGSAPSEENTVEPSPCPEPKPVGPTRILVLGDRTGRPDDELFDSALREAARLKPDLILSVGDLIDGYQPDDKIDEAEAEWDRVLGRIRWFFGDTPLYSAAGNHDVWSDKSEELFGKKLDHGVNFAFDAGSARVILLDSSRLREEAEMADEELDWLWRELRQAKDKSARIVVTHVPLFAIGPGGNYGSKLHDVLIAGNADWVLTGHWHHAMSDDRDGIKYRMIGPSGTAPNRSGHPESGNFPQFGLLIVDDSGADLSLVAVGSILPSDSFPYEFNQLEWKIENRAVEIEDFEIDPLRPRTSGRFFATLTNVADEPINTNLVFESEPEGWRISPESFPISLKPGESKRLRFGFSRRATTPLFPGPIISMKFPWPQGKSYELKRNLSPKLVRAARESSREPRIDGALEKEEWSGALDIGSLTRRSRTGIEGDSTVRVSLVKDSLFVGARLDERDMAGQGLGQNLNNNFYEDEDHIVVLLDPDPSDQFCLRIVVSFSGKVYLSRVNTSDGYADTYPAEIAVKAEVMRGEDFWTVEMSIPLEELGATLGSAEKPGRLWFNFGRSRARENVFSRAYWQPLKEHDVPSFGAIIFR